MKIEKINDWFARRPKWMVQRQWLVLSLFILVFAIEITGLRYFKVNASWEDYFLEDDPMQQFIYERELRTHP